MNLLHGGYLVRQARIDLGSLLPAMMVTRLLQQHLYGERIQLSITDRGSPGLTARHRCFLIGSGFEREAATKDIEILLDQKWDPTQVHRF